MPDKKATNELRKIEDRRYAGKASTGKDFRSAASKRALAIALTKDRTVADVTQKTNAMRKAKRSNDRKSGR